MRWEVALESAALAHQVIEAISEKKGWDIVMLDIRPLSILADYFVIASADSERQLKAILEEVLSRMGRAKRDPLSMEGTADSGWVILDFGGVILHLFTPGQRGYYDLEGLWSDAPLVVRIQ